MPIINNEKMACESCKRGHRSTTCQHYDRVLKPVRKPGRPLSKSEASPISSLTHTRPVVPPSKCSGCSSSTTTTVAILKHQFPCKGNGHNHVAGGGAGYRVQKASSRSIASPNVQQVMDSFTEEELESLLKMKKKLNQSQVTTEENSESPEGLPYQHVSQIQPDQVPYRTNGNAHSRSMSLSSVPAPQNIPFSSHPPGIQPLVTTMHSGMEPLQNGFSPVRNSYSPPIGHGPPSPALDNGFTQPDFPLRDNGSSGQSTPHNINDIVTYFPENQEQPTEKRSCCAPKPSKTIATVPKPKSCCAPASPNVNTAPATPPHDCQPSLQQNLGVDTDMSYLSLRTPHQQSFGNQLSFNSVFQQNYMSPQGNYPGSPAYGTYENPFQPPMWPDNMQMNTNVYPMALPQDVMNAQACTCGEDCQCVACVTHFYNDATRQHIQRLLLEANMQSTSPMNGSGFVPVSQPAQQNIDAGLLIDYQQAPVVVGQVEGLPREQYYFFQVPVLCVGDANACECGDDCDCQGCEMHKPQP